MWSLWVRLSHTAFSSVVAYVGRSFSNLRMVVSSSLAVPFFHHNSGGRCISEIFLCMVSTPIKKLINLYQNIKGECKSVMQNIISMNRYCTNFWKPKTPSGIEPAKSFHLSILSMSAVCSQQHRPAEIVSQASGKASLSVLKTKANFITAGFQSFWFIKVIHLISK